MDGTFPLTEAMKEILFIRRNIHKWRRIEHTIDTAHMQSPDDLAEVYVEVTSDLAFAQTHYPHSRITIYLNNLASALHNKIYRNKRERWGRIVTFWGTEVPLAVYGARRELLYSLVVFLTFVGIGVLSQLGDPDFARVIMGDRYVDMTLDNIARGEPMGVYGQGEEATMFLGITMNNVRVSFLCFASGLLTSFGTGWILFHNGVMVGAFQTFMAQQGYLGESVLAVWLHGTLEISAIVIAGGAGITMGNGWLFPGTYSRIESFRRSARRGVKIVVGTVPVFVVAGFIEGFFTRHTEWADGVRLSVILCSLAFIIFYYIYLPKKRMYGKHAAAPQD